MKPEQQRIKIAEVCGWEWKPYGDCMAWYYNGKMVWNQEVDTLIPKKATTPLPNYPGDLNAMHEAESVLTDEQHGAFRRRLAVIATGRYDTIARLMSTVEYRAWFCATASHRAEAFLRTLGLWEEKGD